MLNTELVKEITEYLIEESPISNVFIGCDSRRRRVTGSNEWTATYVTAIVIHKNNKNGCKVFTEIEEMVDYDQKHDRPFLRMMNEAYKAVEAYEQLSDVLEDRVVEVHLDVNEDEKFGSNVAMSAAKGYVLGTTGREVKIKPEAFAASYAADHVVRLH